MNEKEDASAPVPADTCTRSEVARRLEPNTARAVRHYERSEKLHPVESRTAEGHPLIVDRKSEVEALVRERQEGSDEVRDANVFRVGKHVDDVVIELGLRVDGVARLRKVYVACEKERAAARGYAPELVVDEAEVIASVERERDEQSGDFDKWAAEFRRSREAVRTRRTRAVGGSR